MSEEMEQEAMDLCDESMDDDTSGDEGETIEEEGNESDGPKKVYLPGQPLEDGEKLVVDKSAYKMLHQAQTGAPCLSFDIIKDKLGESRENYPLKMYLLAGTQAAAAHVNNLLVMKVSNLAGTEGDSDDESESDEDDEEGSSKLPLMSVASIKHQGCVNRTRCTKIRGTDIAASWSELGRVSIWNLDEQIKALEDEDTLSEYKKKHANLDVKPVYTFKGHLAEGYGIDWNPTDAGTLATGDCKGNIHIWRLSDNSNGAEWQVDQRPYNSHAPHSVEDLQWSPNEKSVLASCSIDKSIKIWDIRASPQSACMITSAGTHTADINVISWNRKETQFLVSGGDDGLVCVWDLRNFSNSSNSKPVAIFKQHAAPVTTVEWHPDEATVLASGGADNQIAQWDLSVEADDTDSSQNEIAELPPQLLFIHQGQTDIKELHWHPQCPGVLVSTAHSGFNIFRTISV